MGGATRFIMLLSTPFPSLLLHRPSSLFFLRRLRTTTGYTRYLTISPSSIKSFQQNLHTHPLKSHTPNQYSQSHPWTEWSNFIGAINYSHGQQQSPSVLDHGLLQAEDALVVYEEKELSDDFIRSAAACLAFARARPELLGLLSKKDIEVIVTNGTPFIFKSALDTARTMRDFLGVDGANVLESDKASTVDIMKYILSYASKPVGSSIGISLFSRELVESSIRNLLCQITQVSFGNVEQNINAGERQFFGGYDQTHRPVEQHIQMKRGDWICQKCSFMNFARNMKCLECEEARPKRQLVGGEWECPQCNFFNFGKKMVCLRCDCKRPGEVASSQLGYNGYNSDKAASVDRKLGENENTWFDASKQSVQTNQSSSLPLSSPSEQQFTSQNNARNMPFVPLPADKFAKRNQDYKPDFPKDTEEESSQSVSSAANNGSVPATPSSNSWKSGETRPGSEKIDLLQDKKPENWFQRVSELHDVKDSSSSTSDEEFPEMMPMRKGENRFVVSKKKDRSLTSPAYKRQAAMEQGKNPDFVPFVPFPPGYFAKKDKETPDNLDSSAKLSGETSSSSIVGQTAPERTPDLTTRPYNDNDGQRLLDQSPKLSAEQKSPLSGEPSKKTSTIRSMKDEININRFTTEKNMSQPMDLPRGSVQMSENQNIRSIGIGKSLEGSAVKETDPLDMSEEAKAERWFRRVAQIKDISELSQIPDEDFPSIMPMRKGVNRFVVSKRKTPLERRLTSPQYRRNLQSTTSDHVAKDDDSA